MTNPPLATLDLLPQLLNNCKIVIPRSASPVNSPVAAVSGRPSSPTPPGGQRQQLEDVRRQIKRTRLQMRGRAVQERQVPGEFEHYVE
ncbi:hypothetical protein H4I96_01343 [Botrytis cinerea]